MTDTNEPRSQSEAARRAQRPNLIVSLGISLVIGASVGPLLGLYLLSIKEVAKREIVKPASEQKASVDEIEVESRFPRDAFEIPLAPIVTTLGPDKKTNVRMELTLVAAHGTPHSSILENEIREDVIAYLWGLRLSDLEGGRGFQHLRLELEERARVRSRGAVLGILVGGVVVQ